MTELLDAAFEIQTRLTAGAHPFCFIGGLALLRWGEPRLTRDVDATILCRFGDEEELIDYMLSLFHARLKDAHTFALQNRVLLLSATNGIPIDAALGGLPYEERCIDRSSAFSYSPTRALRTCSAEDLIILKAFASRPQDWVDIHGVLIRQHTHLDWQLILQELRPLAALKEDETIVPRLLDMRDDVEASV